LYEQTRSRSAGQLRIPSVVMLLSEQMKVESDGRPL